MRFRVWLYAIAGLVLVLAAILTVIDQTADPFRVEDRYLLGKATIPVVLVATLILPVGLVDFFRWLSRAHGATPLFWSGIGSVIATFVIGLWAAWDWEIVWLIEQDIEVRFARDSLLPLVIALASACAVALIFWLMAKDQPITAQSDRSRSESNLTH
jgi:hypothetical protein